MNKHSSLHNVGPQIIVDGRACYDVSQAQDGSVITVDQYGNPTTDLKLPKPKAGDRIKLGPNTYGTIESYEEFKDMPLSQAAAQVKAEAAKVLPQNPISAEVLPQNPNSSEVLPKNPGLKFDQEKPDLSLLPIEFLTEVAKAMAYGEKKYGRYNYTGGMAWHRIIAASLRHIFAFAAGEDFDPESSVSHLGHAGACILMLTVYVKRNLGTDTREKK